jgi:hypothetical protein
LIESVPDSFEEAELVIALKLQGYRQAQLERHVEPWHAVRLRRHLNSRQIVERIPARPNELVQTLKPRSVHDDLNDAAGIQPHRYDRGDE